MFHGSCLKKLFSAVLLAAVLLSLAGCHGERFNEEEKTALEERGAATMKAWLEEHTEDGKVLTTQADVYMYPSGPTLLTDYAVGTCSVGERTRDYLVNTATDAVYLLHDGMLLTEVCLDYAFEKLELEGLREECGVSGQMAAMDLPDRGNSYSGVEHSPELVWMPGKLALSLESVGQEEQRRILSEFVFSPDTRGLIRFSGTFRVPDEVDLEKLDMAYWERQQEENGIVFTDFNMSDSLENISNYAGRVSYERYCFREIEDPDIRIRMKDTYQVEKSGKNGIEVVEGGKYDLSDLTFEKTKDGYLVKFTDYDHRFDFAIYADEGSEFLKNEYHSHEDREAYLSPGTKISGDRYFENDLYWKEAGEDGWILTDDNGIRKLFFGGEELIPRGPRQ